MSNLLTELIPSIRLILCLSRVNKLSKFHTPKLILFSGPGLVYIHPEFMSSFSLIIVIISWLRAKKSAPIAAAGHKAIRFLEEINFEYLLNNKNFVYQIEDKITQERRPNKRGQINIKTVRKKNTKEN